jgi:hypothetical protein
MTDIRSLDTYAASYFHRWWRTKIHEGFIHSRGRSGRPSSGARARCYGRRRPAGRRGSVGIE